MRNPNRASGFARQGAQVFDRWQRNGWPFLVIQALFSVAPDTHRPHGHNHRRLIDVGIVGVGHVAGALVFRWLAAGVLRWRLRWQRNHVAVDAFLLALLVPGPGLALPVAGRFGVPERLRVVRLAGAEGAGLSAAF